MTKEQALKQARRQWGGTAFVERDEFGRCVVGCRDFFQGAGETWFEAHREAWAAFRIKAREMMGVRL